MTTHRPAPSGTVAATGRIDAVTVWLCLVLVMVYAMVILGGLTRLTQSGLSIVDWNPIIGVVPPLDDRAWQEAFDAYKRFPEYQRVNYGMTLVEFKAIYLMEWFHRLWGRLIGVAFALPFMWFLAQGRVRGPFAWRLAGIFALGGAQGLMGWVMVKSGLVDDPRVSAPRLAAHLMIAVAIYLMLLWIVLGRIARPALGRIARPALGHIARPAGDAAMRRPVLVTLMLALVTVTSGAFVAGLDAGMDYNTFPLMDGRLVPEGLLMLEPVWRNPLENVAMVQFNHRMLAVTLVLAVLLLASRALKTGLEGRARTAILLCAAMALVQMALGIATLILVVPVSLGVLHQAGAMALLGLLTWALWENRRPAADAA